MIEWRPVCFSDGGIVWRTVAEFQNLNEDDWKDYMIHRFHQVYPDFPLDEDENRGQVKAWKNCFKVMQKALTSAKHPDTIILYLSISYPMKAGAVQMFYS